MNTPGQTILIVDDRPDNLFVLEHVLAPLDARVVAVGSGNDALKATLHHDFALAILDVQMPEMDGYELAELLRGAEGTRTLPLIFLSAVHFDEQHVFRGYEAGAVDFMTKPYRSEILLAKVRVFLELDRQRRELRAAVAVERSKRQLERILLALSDAVLVIDAGARVIRANEALLALLGRAEAEVIGAHLGELLGAAADGPPARIAAAFASGRFEGLSVRNQEMLVQRSNGAQVPVLLSSAPLPPEADEADEPPGAVLLLKDIGAIAAARQALRRSEERYRRLFDASRDGIAFIEADGRVGEANAALTGMLGSDPAGACPAELARAAAAADGEVLLQRADGRRFPAAVSAWPVDAAGGVGTWMLVRDLSEERRLAQDRIVTEKMSALGQMVGGIAHELNNPLMGITGYVEYCRERQPADSRCRDILDDALRETRRCKELVDNLLLFARVERSGEDAFTPVDCAELVARVLRLMDYRIRHEKVAVVRNFGAAGEPLHTRPQALQQVLLNLVVNALDAMQGRQRRELRIALDCGADPVRITIEDTGNGIPAEQMTLIFDPFYTTKPVGKGTGLGLSVSKGIIEGLGGEIRCESTPGVGTRFTLSLQRAARARHDDTA
ncbi:MAG: response regulator [Thiohalocapsa sp.]|uniref:ATP-binding protein n=1 Tax=Thiohalocapsa sp. TaxID=2497641 RepID=UPI0025FC2C82|nr:ATP-binding protein [Thiohalocapsa sp.]MCG6943601.1 response regulator [Thiohalocapsa sp.]